MPYVHVDITKLHYVAEKYDAKYERSDRIYFSSTQNNQVSKKNYNTEFRLYFSNISIRQ